MATFGVCVMFLEPMLPFITSLGEHKVHVIAFTLYSVYIVSLFRVHDTQLYRVIKSRL